MDCHYIQRCQGARVVPHSTRLPNRWHTNLVFVANLTDGDKS